MSEDREDLLKTIREQWNMENKIKPIETIYNGYKFRSRLEARWAVFFDAAGIPYEYELEGYQLRDGTRYLPDFYLPDLHIFVEVKPEHVINKDGEIKEEKDKHKVKLFVEDVIKVPESLFITNGDPYNTYLTMGRFKCVSMCFKWIGMEKKYVECEEDCTNCLGAFCLSFKGLILPSNVFRNAVRIRDRETDFSIFGKMKVNHPFIPCVEQFVYFPDKIQPSDIGSPANLSNIIGCALKARQARFEHGEKG